MSVTLFKTSILAAFVSEIKVSFLLLVKYHVQCSSEISEPKYTQKTCIRKTRKRVKKKRGCASTHTQKGSLVFMSYPFVFLLLPYLCFFAIVSGVVNVKIICVFAGRCVTKRAKNLTSAKSFSLDICVLKPQKKMIKLTFGEI